MSVTSFLPIHFNFSNLSQDTEWNFCVETTLCPMMTNIKRKVFWCKVTKRNNTKTVSHKKRPNKQRKLCAKKLFSNH